MYNSAAPFLGQQLISEPGPSAENAFAVALHSSVVNPTVPLLPD